MRTRGTAPAEILAVAPNGRRVWVRAAPRGYTVRELQNGSGSIEGDILRGAVSALQWATAQLTRRWVIGVVSADEEPWRGQRRFHLERAAEADVSSRMSELARQVEAGIIEVPLPRDWRLRRKVTSRHPGD